jgi:hypothetical protein
VTTDAYLSSEHAHTEDIQSLAADIFSTHVDNTFHAKASAYGGSGNTMLACTRLGNDSLLADPSCEENL